MKKSNPPSYTRTIQGMKIPEYFFGSRKETVVVTFPTGPMSDGFLQKRLTSCLEKQWAAKPVEPMNRKVKK